MCHHHEYCIVLLHNLHEARDEIDQAVEKALEQTLSTTAEQKDFFKVSFYFLLFYFVFVSCH